MGKNLGIIALHKFREIPAAYSWPYIVDPHECVKKYAYLAI
jgi:hypothetical protein